MAADKKIKKTKKLPLDLLILEGLRVAVAKAIAEHKKAGRDVTKVQSTPCSKKGKRE